MDRYYPLAADKVLLALSFVLDIEYLVTNNVICASVQIPVKRAATL